MIKFFFRFLFYILCLYPLLIKAQGITTTDTSGIAQNKRDEDKLSGEELANYEKQARQLVSFMEFAFNTLGSADAEFKDKHTIIEQSYLKFFKDSKVQIEDDLENREIVTNKDVQAYLKDIDFFFKSVSFKYTIEEINQEINEAGEVFFLIKASRNLKGITLEGKQVNENKPRYIEINIDQSNRGLKIVSVYTTKSNEEQELIAWWNSLDTGWRNFLAADSKVLDTVNLKNIVLIHNDYIVRETLYTGYSDTLSIVDTIDVNQSRILPEVRRILRADEINITGVEGIYDLKPLYAFTGLKHLIMTGARVPDLDPIRNLSKLETLVAGKSLIISVEPIRYIPNLRILDLSGTLITDLSPLEDFEALEVLNLSDSRIADISVIKNLIKLRELNISRLQVTNVDAVAALSELQVLELTGLPLNSLAPLANLNKLQRLVLDQTGISTLTDVLGLSALQYLSIDNTLVNSLGGLEKLSQLKVIYCDKTQVTKAQALAFMQLRPDTRVIYESQELIAWWETIPKEWKELFAQVVKLDSSPSREQLHEVSFIRTLNLSGNHLITSLEPIEKLTTLSEIDLSNSSIKSIKPLANSFDLQSLNVSHTRINDLSPLSALTSLKEVDISNSAVTSIEPLVKLPELKVIKMDSTNIVNTALLSNIKRLETIYADGVQAISADVNRIWDSIPNALIIYQTGTLKNWWKGLSPDWKGIFREHGSFTDEPDRVMLHTIASIRDLDLTKYKSLNNIGPLSALQLLENLNISNLQISDLNPLGSNHRLRMIDISNTPVAGLSSLSNHKKLINLNCANSPVEDLQPIAGFTDLKHLNISGTQITKLDPLESCTNIEELNCYNTRISSLKALEGLKNIKTLRAYNTKLSERKIEKFKELHPQAEVIFY